MNLFGEQPGLIDRGIRSCLNIREHHTLIFSRSQFPLREDVERYRQACDNHPEDNNHGAVPESAGQYTSVNAAHAIEAAVDPAGEAAFGISRAQQPGTHHWRERQCDHAGNDDGAGEREREFPEQRACESALDAYRRIHCGQRDRHGNNRADELARSVDRRAERGLAVMKVPLHVFHHHDRVINNQTDREHDREQRKQVDGESCHEHQEHRANERNRNRNDGDDHGAHRAKEKEDDHDNDEERFSQSPENLVNGVLDVFGRIVRNADLHPRRYLSLDLRHRLANLTDHVQRVRGRQHPHSHKGCGLAIETNVLLVVLGAENDIRNLA